MNNLQNSFEIRKMIYDKYCPVIANLLSISTPFRFVELPPDDRSVAYTILNGAEVTNIFVNPFHPMFASIQDPLRQFSVFTGVLIHEILHKKYTEPACSLKVGQKENLAHFNLFHSISNIIEDFTIETRAILDLQVSSQTIETIRRTTGISFQKKKPLAALDSAIIACWSQSPAIQSWQTVCDQVMSALINFTDLGPLAPGSTLSEEAAELYRKVAPMIYEAIWKTPMERAQIALNIYREMEPYLDANEPSYDQAAQDTRGTNGEAEMSEVSQEDRKALENSEVLRVKAQIIRQLRKQTAESGENAPKSGSSGKEQCPEPYDSAKDHSSDQGIDSRSDSESGTAAQGENGSSEETADTALSESNDSENTDCPASNDASNASEAGNSSDHSEQDSADTDSEGSGSSGTHSSGDENESMDEVPDPQSAEASDSSSAQTEAQVSESGSPDTVPELPSLVFTPDDGILGRILAAQAEMTNEQFDVSDLKPGSISHAADFSAHDKKCVDRDLHQEVSSDFFDGKAVRCENYRVTGISAETYGLYEDIKQRNSAEIAKFTSRMKKLVSESESRSFEKNGRLSLKRYAAKGNSTVNLFTRKSLKDRRDSRVLICLDVSGSMAGNKISKAGEALVCIVEGLTGAGIPVKVITFCESGNTVVHHHYVNYGSSRLDRASLMLIEPGGCNFDGFSIRYAVKDLMKKRVQHDMLIVISDGQPNSRNIQRANLLPDTAAAVMEAKRQTRVIGIGIDANIDVLKGFYKDTFVEMTDIENLMRNLSRLIEKEVRSW